MKDDNLKSNPEDSSANSGELPEVKAVPLDSPPQPEIISHEELSEDDVIVYLDDDVEICNPENTPDLLSHRPGEEDVLTEFERLPEVQAELVEDIPEVLSVDDVTALVSEEVDTDWSEFFADQALVLERVRLCTRMMLSRVCSPIVPVSTSVRTWERLTVSLLMVNSLI